MKKPTLAGTGRCAGKGRVRKKTRRMRYTGSQPTVCRQEVCPSLKEALPHRGKCRASQENRDTFTVCRQGYGSARGGDVPSRLTAYAFPRSARYSSELLQTPQSQCTHR